MKTTPGGVTILWAAFFLCALPAAAQIRTFDASRFDGRLSRFREVDFETLPLLPPLSPPLTNPLTIDSVTFRDPATLRNGFCSAPTCLPDSDNPDGGNMDLFLNAGGTISFATAPRLVVLDIQGMGDNPFVLLVTDARGRTLLVQDQGELFGQKLVGLFSNGGISNVQVASVGGTGGPLVLAGVLFSRK